MFQNTVWSARMHPLYTSTWLNMTLEHSFAHNQILKNITKNAHLGIHSYIILLFDFLCWLKSNLIGAVSLQYN